MSKRLHLSLEIFGLHKSLERTQTGNIKTPEAAYASVLG
jgi:hypothetical protein